MLNKIRIALLIIFIPILFACLKLEAEMKIRRSGVVDLELEYLIDKKYADYGRGFGADEPWPIPLTEKDFRLQALRNYGIEILSYKRKELSDGSDRISIKLQADSMEAVGDFFNWDIRLEETGKKGTVIFILPAPKGFQLEESTQLILKELLADSEFILRIKPPGKPITAIGGDLVGHTAVFNISLQKLAMTQESVIWSITW